MRPPAGFTPPGMTLEEVKKRNRIAEMLMANRNPAPRSLGQGIASAGGAIGAALAGRGARKAEEQYNKEQGERFNATVAQAPEGIRAALMGLKGTPNAAQNVAQMLAAHAMEERQGAAEAQRKAQAEKLKYELGLRKAGHIDHGDRFSQIPMGPADPAYQRQLPNRGTTVNVNSGQRPPPPPPPKPPSGYDYRRDAEGYYEYPFRQERIDGGPAADAAFADQMATEGRLAQKQDSANIVLDEIEKVRDVLFKKDESGNYLRGEDGKRIRKDDWDSYLSTGIAGQAAAYSPDSGAGKIQAAIGTLTSNGTVWRPTKYAPEWVKS